MKILLRPYSYKTKKKGPNFCLPCAFLFIKGLNVMTSRCFSQHQSISLGVSEPSGKNILLHILIPFPKKRTLLCFNVWMCVHACFIASIVADSLRPCGPYNLSGSSVCEDSPGKKTGVGCHALLQGIFLTQGLNPGLQAGSLPLV